MAGGNDSNTVLLLHCDGSDQHTTFNDNSVGGSHGNATVNGSAEGDTQYKQFGTASLLNASGAYLSYIDDADWYFGTGKFTIDMWIRASSFPFAMTLVSQYEDFNLFWFLDAYSDNIKFEVNGGSGSTTCNASVSLSTDTWYHIAVILGWGGVSDTLAICLNGTMENTATSWPTMPNFAAGLQIGAIDTGANFRGNLDEIRISKGVARWESNFSVPEVPYDDSSSSSSSSSSESSSSSSSFSSCSSSCSSSSSSCSAEATHPPPDIWYKFEDDFTDSIGGYDLTKTGTIDFVTGVRGDKAARAYWASSGELKNTTYTGLSDNDPWTVSYWFKCDGHTSGAFGQRLGPAIYAFLFGSEGFRFEVNEIYQNPDETIGMRFIGTGIKNYSNPYICGDGWVHYCWTYNGAVIKYYYNGVDQNEDYAWVGQLDNTATTKVQIFSNSEGDYFLDDVKLWERQLCAAEVANEFAGSSSSSSSCSSSFSSSCSSCSSSFSSSCSSSSSASCDPGVEQLGPELVNGGVDMEDPYWIGVASPDTNEQEASHDGRTNVRHIVDSPNGRGGCRPQNMDLINGETYKIVYWIKVNSGDANVRFRTISGGNIEQWYHDNSTWQQYTQYSTANFTASDGRLDLRNRYTDASVEFRIDNVSVKRVVCSFSSSSSCSSSFSSSSSCSSSSFSSSSSSSSSSTSCEDVGAEQITNGDMELDSGWGSHLSPTTNEQSDEQAHGGTYSRKFVVDGINEGIMSNTYPIVAGRGYVIDFWVYPVDETSITFRMYRPGSTWVTVVFDNLTTGAWNLCHHYHDADESNANAILVIHSGDLSSGTWYVDDVSVTSCWSSSSSSSSSCSSSFSSSCSSSVSSFSSSCSSSFSSGSSCSSSSHSCSLEEELGPDLIVNGGFDDDSWWTTGPNWSIGGGVLTGAATTDATNRLNVLEQDKVYRVQFDILNYSSGLVKIKLGTNEGIARSANGTYVEDIVCFDNETFAIQGQVTAFSGDIDNVSCKRILCQSGSSSSSSSSVSSCSSCSSCDSVYSSSSSSSSCAADTVIILTDSKTVGGVGVGAGAWDYDDGGATGTCSDCDDDMYGCINQGCASPNDNCYIYTWGWEATNRWGLANPSFTGVCTEIRVCVRGDSDTDEVFVSLWDGSNQIGGDKTVTLTPSTSNQWTSSWDVYEQAGGLNNLQVQLVNDDSLGNEFYIYEVSVELTYCSTASFSSSSCSSSCSSCSSSFSSCSSSSALSWSSSSSSSASPVAQVEDITLKAWLSSSCSSSRSWSSSSSSSCSSSNCSSSSCSSSLSSSFSSSCSSSRSFSSCSSSFSSSSESVSSSCSSSSSESSISSCSSSWSLSSSSSSSRSRSSISVSSSSRSFSSSSSSESSMSFSSSSSSSASESSSSSSHSSCSSCSSSMSWSSSSQSLSSVSSCSSSSSSASCTGGGFVYGNNQFPYGSMEVDPLVQKHRKIGPSVYEDEFDGQTIDRDIWPQLYEGEAPWGIGTASLSEGRLKCHVRGPEKGGSIGLNQYLEWTEGDERTIDVYTRVEVGTPANLYGDRDKSPVRPDPRVSNSLSLYMNNDNPYTELSGWLVWSSPNVVPPGGDTWIFRSPPYPSPFYSYDPDDYDWWINVYKTTSFDEEPYWTERDVYVRISQPYCWMRIRATHGGDSQFFYALTEPTVDRDWIEIDIYTGDFVEPFVNDFRAVTETGLGFWMGGNAGSAPVDNYADYFRGWPRSNWRDYGSPTVNERTSEQSHQGNYSRKFVAEYRPGDQGPQGILSEPFLLQEQGEIYPAIRGDEFEDGQVASFWLPEFAGDGALEETDGRLKMSVSTGQTWITQGGYATVTPGTIDLYRKVQLSDPPFETTYTNCQWGFDDWDTEPVTWGDTGLSLGWNYGSGEESYVVTGWKDSEGVYYTENYATVSSNTVWLRMRLDPTGSYLYYSETEPTQDSDWTELVIDIEADWIPTTDITFWMSMNPGAAGNTATRTCWVDYVRAWPPQTADYRLDFWCYPVDRNKVRVTLKNDFNSYVYSFTGLIPNQWNRCTRIITVEEQLETHLAFHSGAQESGTWYIDDVRLQKAVCESSSSSCSSSSSSG